MVKRGRGRGRDRGGRWRNRFHRSSEFMKVFLPALNYEKLQIPPHFVRNFRGLLKEKTQLKGPDDKLWDVVLEENNEGFFINNGWQAFADYYSLRLGEFLIFKYERKFLFSAKIFRRSGVRAEFGRVKIEVGEAEESQGENLIAPKRPCNNNAQKDSNKADKLKGKVYK